MLVSITLCHFAAEILVKNVQVKKVFGIVLYEAPTHIP